MGRFVRTACRGVGTDFSLPELLGERQALKRGKVRGDLGEDIGGLGEVKEKRNVVMKWGHLGL